MSMIVRRFQELSPVIILSDQILIRYHLRSFSFWYLAMPSTEIWCRSDGCRVHRDVSMFYKCFVAIWYPFEGPQQSKISPNISEQLRGVVLCRKKIKRSWRPGTTLVNQQLIAKWNIDQFEDLCPFLLNMRDFSNDHYYVVSLPGLVPGFHLVGGVRFASLNRVYEMEKLRPSNILGPRSYTVKDHPDPTQWAQ